MTLASAGSGCAIRRTEVIILEPPELPQEAFDELIQGECPHTLEWYWDEYDPYLMKLEEAADAGGSS